MKWLIACLVSLVMVSAAFAGQDPYIAIVGNDAITGVGLGNGVANPFYFSQKYQQFLYDQDLLSVPVCEGEFPPNTPQTRVTFGPRGCEQFRANKKLDQPEICDTEGTVIPGVGNDPDTFTFFGEPNSMISKQNAGYYEWYIRLPKKPSGELNICIQCGVLKPNAFAFIGMTGNAFDAVRICAAETGERIGSGLCTRDQVPAGINPIVSGALPQITAMAFPGPESLGFRPFHLTAYKNPGPYSMGLPFDFIDAMVDPRAFQVLDGSPNSRVLLKACMDKCVVAKLPVTGQPNPIPGEVENDLEEGDIIAVRLDVPDWNTVDIYCSSQSARVMGVGEAP